MNPWFIFTSTGAVYTTYAVGITQAVAGFKRLKHPRAGEIVGVIKGNAQIMQFGTPMPTAVFGVICCMAETPTATPLETTRKG